MSDNKFNLPDAPPPPLFFNQKERDFVKQVNDEIIERIIGQRIFYYPIDTELTNFHPLYGEAIEKNFLPPVHVHALVEFEGSETESNEYVDAMQSLMVHFHKRRLTDDQNLFVRVGDFIAYGSYYYEIVKLTEPKELFGQADRRFEISAKCVRSREGLFDGS